MPPRGTVAGDAARVEWSWELDELKRGLQKDAAEIGATEFKARCLELMRQVQQRQRNSVTTTKRGKPLVRLVPVQDDARAFYGCLPGLARVHGDLTAPVTSDWEALSD